MFTPGSACDNAQSQMDNSFTLRGPPSGTGDDNPSTVHCPRMFSL